MTRLEKYQKKLAEIRGQMEAALDAADAKETNPGEMTADESDAFKKLEAAYAAEEVKVKREEALATSDAAASVVRTTAASVTSITSAANRVSKVKASFENDRLFRGYASHRDFLMSVFSAQYATNKDDVSDERLRALCVRDDEAGGQLAFLMPNGFNPSAVRQMQGQIINPNYQAAAGSDEQGEYDDRYGGFAVPSTMLPGMLTLGMEGDPTLGRTQDLPMQTPTVKILARVDKNHQTSVSGGLTVTRRPETVKPGSSRMAMELVTLHATSLFGLGYQTEELLADSPLSFIAILDRGFRDQFAHHMLSEKIRGKGGDEYLGVLTATGTNKGPTVVVAKESGQAPDTFNAANAINMRAQCWNYSQAIWIANHDTLPQMMRLALIVQDEGATPVGAGAISLYHQSMREDRPDTLLGRPIFYSEYPNTLGDQGDVILGVWSEFLDGLYQPLQSAESVHVRFENHERTFKFWLRNAGAPWWRTPLTPHKGANQLSPFLVMAPRA